LQAENLLLSAEDGVQWYGLPQAAMNSKYAVQKVFPIRMPALLVGMQRSCAAAALQGPGSLQMRMHCRMVAVDVQTHASLCCAVQVECLEQQLSGKEQQVVQLSAAVLELSERQERLQAKLAEARRK
jgi:hypothetical protein